MRTRFTLLFLTLIAPTALRAQSADDRFVEQLLRKHALPAISLAVVTGDSIAYSAAMGVRSRDQREPVDEQTLFSAASLSKPLFAYLVMQLVESGQLALDRPVSEYFVYEDLAHDPRHEKVTPRMLLSHSAGLPNWRDGKLTFQRDPGTGFQYSGEGYVWLMLAVEHLSGKSINELASERVFAPLGMTRSSFVWRDSFRNFALPHNAWDEPGPKRKPAEGNSAYSLQTTARDFARLLLALFTPTGLSEATVAEIARPQVDVEAFFGGEPVPGAEGVAYWGLGWGLQRSDRGMALWQWGDNGPFKAYVVAYPERKKGLVYFANHQHGLRLVPELVEYFLEDESPAFALLGYSMRDPAYLRFGKALLRSGYDTAAGPFLAGDGPALDTALLSMEDLRQLAYQLWERDRPEEAERVLRAATGTYPEAAELWQQTAFFLLAQNRPQDAEYFYEKGRSMAPKLFAVENLLLPWKNRVEEANVRLRLEGYEDSKLVMLAGSFNEWSPQTTPMVRSKAGWVAALRLPPGEYGYKFVVDGEWITDPANKETVEEGGYVNSLLVVK